MQILFALISSVVMGALANVFIKVGATRLPAISWSNFWEVATSPFIILGAALFILNFPVYSFLLQKMKLGVAVPLVTSLTILLVVLISAFYLKENLSSAQYIGIFLMLASLWFLAR